VAGIQIKSVELRELVCLFIFTCLGLNYRRQTAVTSARDASFPYHGRFLRKQLACPSHSWTLKLELL
jgi:hypothetical protein